MNAKFRTTILVVAVILAAPLGRAQLQERGAARRRDACVLGEIDLGNRLGTGLTVELRAAGLDLEQQVVPVPANGDFQFECVPSGEYRLQVVDAYGSILRYEMVSLHDGDNSLRIDLPEEHLNRPASGTVSIRELERKVDPQAQKEVRKAQAAAQHRRFDKAIEHLDKALDRDPAFAEAYIALGVVYADLNHYDQAADEFSKAAELDPDSALAHSNLAISQMRLHRYAAAEQAARRALKIDDTLRQMEYVLGASLTAQQRNAAEALECLERAARAFPSARLLAARLLAQAGRLGDAADQLRRYLRSSDTSTNRQQIEAWLARLNVPAGR